jgi:putative ABC transport system substrate-binding protein
MGNGIGVPRSAAAANRPARIGLIGLGSASTGSDFYETLRRTLAELGYVEGRDIVYLERWAADDASRVRSLVDELVRSDVDVVITQGGAVRVAYEATKARQVPLVFSVSSDPVLGGFAASLARPGGHATGISHLVAELNTKRIQILREIFPDLRRVAILSNPLHLGEEAERDNILKAAATLGLSVGFTRVTHEAQIAEAVAALRDERPDALVVLADLLLLQQRRRIIDFALSERIPAIASWSQFARSGYLFSYGPKFSQSWRQATAQVVKILNGTKPGDIPVEQPTAFEFAVNLATAGRLGVTIPPSVLARADEVIE